MSGNHPGTLPLRLYRGDSYAWQVRAWNDDAKTDPVDLAEATAAARIAGPDTIVDLECTVTAPNLIDLVLPAPAWSGVLALTRWDLQLSWSDGRVYTLIAGPVSVSPDVTP